LLGQAQDWTQLDQFLLSYMIDPALRPTVFASSFAASLEMVREGVAEMHQHAAFAPIYMRRRMLAGEIAGDSAAKAGPRAIEG
jgi:segregation and condensation protein A